MRVAGAVPTLVVVQHGRHRGQEVVEALDEPRAGDGVPPDLAELFIRQRAWLAQHRRVDRDLADVVQRTAQPECLEPSARPAESHGKCLRECGHPRGVAAKVWIPGLESGREGGEEGPHTARFPERRRIPFPLA
jgi:hypothetical protein